jgi:hypothetical protein
MVKCEYLFSHVETTNFLEEVTSMSVFEKYPRITPFLWFDNNAEDAVNFYLSVFRNSRRLEVVRNLNSTVRSLRRSTAARCSSSPKRSRLSSVATRKKR